MMLASHSANASQEASRLGSLEPCHIANPELWKWFCILTKRENYPSEHWTERDVIAVIQSRMHNYDRR